MKVRTLSEQKYRYMTLMEKCNFTQISANNSLYFWFRILFLTLINIYKTNIKPFAFLVMKFDPNVLLFSFHLLFLSQLLMNLNVKHFI